MKTVALLGDITRSPVTGMWFPLPTNVPLQTNSTEMTSFRNDFKRPEPRQPPRPLPPPEPAVQLSDCGSHSAAATTDNYISTSQLAFALPQLPPSSNQKIHHVGNGLYCTNFKMDADRRLKVNETTTLYEYSSKPFEPPNREYACSVLKLSQPGPLGNRPSESLENRSEYCQSFATTPVIKDGHQLKKMHQCTDPITGQISCIHYYYNTKRTPSINSYTHVC